MQTLLMTMVLLSLAGALFLLIIFMICCLEKELEYFSSFIFVFPVESSGIFVRTDR